LKDAIDWFRTPFPANIYADAFVLPLALMRYRRFSVTSLKHTQNDKFTIGYQNITALYLIKLIIITKYSRQQ